VGSGGRRPGGERELTLGDGRSIVPGAAVLAFRGGGRTNAERAGGCLEADQTACPAPGQETTKAKQP